ncbi:MAG: dihydrolipoyl dehydrogenase [Tissierellia bacterium]|nr:dihydrolipoyl dehydrogenase [Tissierellia bacterium]
MKVVVIGGGPGGYVAAIRAAQLGGEVTLIEKEYLGGTCLNVGCIPTKSLLHSAELYEEAKEAAKYGVIINDIKIDFTKVQERKSAVTKQLVNGVKGLLAANKVKVVTGEASFVSKDKVEVKTENKSEIIKADKFIIATGSVPAKPPILGIDSEKCIDSTGALELKEIPKSIVIVGGGVIGIEIATLYNSLGSKVVVVEMLDEILPMMDGELTKIIRAKLAKKGVEIFTSSKVMSFKEAGENIEVSVQMKDNSIKVFSGDKALISIGRRTNTSSHSLDKAGIKHDRGKIIANDKMETNVPGIYAVGDCLGKIMLAHIASAQGEIAAENALGQNKEFDSKTNPSCVYTKPEFASVGLTEEAAKAQGVDYIVGKFPLAANGRSMIMGEDGMIKIIAGKKYKEVLGAHIVGPRATDMIGELSLAIGMEATIDEVIETIHAHPTVAEAIKEATLAVEKRAIHIPNR